MNPHLLILVGRGRLRSMGVAITQPRLCHLARMVLPAAPASDRGQGCSDVENPLQCRPRITVNTRWAPQQCNGTAVSNHGF